jgi:hypothetical protein
MPELLFIAFALMAGLSVMTLAMKGLLALALLIERLGTSPRTRPTRSETWARA